LVSDMPLQTHSAISESAPGMTPQWSQEATTNIANRLSSKHNPRYQ